MSTPRYDILRVRVTAEDAETLRTLLREVHPDVGGHPTRGADGRCNIDTYVPSDQVAVLEREGVTVEKVGNASEAGRLAQAQVGTGDRFAAESARPRGLAVKVKD